MEDPTTSLFLAQVHAEARRHTGWMKFVGVFLIIAGIPSAIFLIGILEIWLGILLLQAAQAVEREGEAGLLTFVARVGTYFKVYGILAIIGVVLAVAMIGLMIFGVLHEFGRSGVFT